MPVICTVTCSDKTYILEVHLNIFHQTHTHTHTHTLIPPEHFSSSSSVTAARFPFSPLSSVFHCEHVITVHCFGSKQFTPKNRRVFSVWFTPSGAGGRKEIFPISHTFISSFSIIYAWTEIERERERERKLPRSTNKLSLFFSTNTSSLHCV